MNTLDILGSFKPHIKHILCSFSGGRTSALMTKMIMDNVSDDYKIHVVFANTGQESEETLEFVRDCDEKWGLGVVWVEALVKPKKGDGTSFIITEFKNAKRDGSLFEDMVSKYGIPNVKFPHCTRELKERPIHAYMRSLGLRRRDYKTAIGIRADEMDRINSRYQEFNYIYPLYYADIAKADVVSFWESQDFSLDIEDRLGNCVWCWKKSFRKHKENMQSHPQIYEIPDYLEKKYGTINSPNGSKRTFFRGNRSTQDLLSMGVNDGVDMDKSGDCSESCEIGNEI